MTLKEKVLQTFVVTIREVNKHGGPEKFFEKYPVGGMYYGNLNVLYDENGLEMGTQMSLDKLNECKKYSPNLFVCADEAQLRGQTERMGAGSALATGKAEDAYNYGKIMGMQMNESGIDWVLMPAIDIAAVDYKPFSSGVKDPKRVAKTFSGVVRGIQDQGVCATVKHFPGLGASNINMHFAPGRNTLDFDTWTDTYGYTYKEMFKQDVMCVMTTHITLRSYDNEGSDGFYPIATYSKKLTTELLKEKLGFKGAVVTDALIMGGMATGNLIKETVQAFKAGADFLLWPPVEAADEIVRQLESGEIPRSRLDDALNRIERMKKFRKKALEEKKIDKPDVKFADEALRDMKKRGVSLTRNNIGLVPLSKSVQSFLIVDITNGDNSSEMLRDELIKRGVKAEIRKDIYDEPSRVCWQDDIDEIQSKYDIVIFNLNVDYENSWGEPFMRVWASHLFDKSKKIIINYNSTYFTPDFFPEDPTVIEPNAGATATIVKHIVDGLFGEAEFSGECLFEKC